MYYTLTKGAVAFILEGREQVAALRAKVTVEKEDIVAIQWRDVFRDWSPMLVRMPGSYLPRFIMAGSYWSDDGWYFVYARKPRGLAKPILHNVIVIETKKDRYKYLVIETAKENAQEIIAWWQEHR